jgi:uncharacterized protein (UPF0332 family)
MDISDCIYAAEKNIYDARRHLETGNAVNWVYDEIYTAVMWAMEAWLLGKGYSPNKGGGWRSIHYQFLQLAPDDIRNPVSYCASRAVMLDYDLQGGFDHKEEPMPFERWKELAFELIGKAEEGIVAIEKDIGCTEDELKKLWLFQKNAND